MSAVLARAERLWLRHRALHPPETPPPSVILPAGQWALARLGLTLDDWQVTIAETQATAFMAACARQVGKSESLLVKIAHRLMHFPGLVAILANGDRTAGELFGRAHEMLRTAGARISAADDNKRSCSLISPRSRLLALPAAPDTVRGIAGVKLLLLDEAAYMPPDLFAAVEPMAAASGGQVLYASSPNGQLGRFWDLWQAGLPRVHVTAYNCSRISAEFLEQQRRTMTRRAFAAEYLASFEDAEGALFSGESITAAMVPVGDSAGFGSLWSTAL